MAENTDNKTTPAIQREHAKMLFLKGMKQNEIAQQVGSNPNQINRWANDPKDNWFDQRELLATTKQEQLVMLYKMLGKLTSEGNAALEDDDPDTNPDADKIAKISKSIERLEKDAGIGEMLQTVIALIKFVQKENIEAAKVVSMWGNLFIQEKMSENNG